jgi:hypothetical protein
MAAQPTGKKKKSKQKGQRSWTQLAAAPTEIVEPSSYFEPQPQPQPELHEPEPELPASAQQLGALTVVPMVEWSEEQVLAWAELVEFDGETRAALRAAFNDEETEGEELVALTAKPLQKMLKRAGLLGDLAATAEAVLATRDAFSSATATKPNGVRVGSLCFDPEDPASRLGYGRFGEVFRGRHGEGGEACAVKRVARLRFEREGGLREIKALRHAQDTADDGHRNVVRYIDQQDDANFVYIAMTLCDETLEDRIQRKGLAEPAARRTACAELCSGLAYLHELPSGSITHRDLKPSNLLFKGDCLKIADMGQSRVLALGETAVEPGSSGGTQVRPAPLTRGRRVLYRSHIYGSTH